LAACFLALDDDTRLGRHLAKHADDGMAAIVYTRALWQYRQSGAGRQADGILREALKHNPHLPAYLLGERALPPEAPGFIGWGDEAEAVAYVFEFGEGWSDTPGALAWLHAQARK